MKEFNLKKYLAENNLLKEDKLPTKLSTWYTVPGGSVYKVVVTFDDGSTEKFRSEDEAEKKYDLSDVEREESEFDVSEGFKDYLGYSESKMPSQEEVDKFFTDTQNEMHYLASKPVMGQKGDRVRSEIEPWDEYDLSNWNALVKKNNLSKSSSLIGRMGDRSLNELDSLEDPVMAKLRRRQMQDDKEKAKQAHLDKKYGKNFMDKLEAEIVLKQQLDDLKSEREQIMIDMEQEAEPEGGEIADDYGSRLNDIDSRMGLIQKDIDDLRMYESINEDEDEYVSIFHYYDKLNKDIKDKKDKDKVNEDEIPAFMMRDGMYRELIDDSVNYNDFEKRIYGFVGPKFYKTIHSEYPGALKDFYDKFRVTNPNLSELELDVTDSGNPETTGDEAIERESASPAFESKLTTIYKTIKK